MSSTHTRDVYYGYDLRGLQTYARFDYSTGEGITSAYDGFGRLASSTQVMDGASRTLSYLHDKNSNRWRVSHPDGNYFDYAFDGLDRMYYGNVNSAIGIFQTSFNNRGFRSSLGSGSWTYYGYDAVGRLNALTQDIAGATYDVSYAFGFNTANQVTTRSTSNDAYVWTGAQNVSRSYAVNGLNQYTSAGPATFTYDANGNLTGDGGSSYVYDIENRLVSASGVTSASLRYDPLGRLYETAGGAAGTVRFLYDGDELVAEYGGSGNMLRRYVHGSGSDDPMAWFEGASVDASVAKLIKTNHQGSVVALTDWYGNLASINIYDEWGIPAQTNSGRFQYTGQAWIPELRMYNYKARIYSPTLGRFLQTDPIGYDDHVNLYAYVGNDPVNKNDPAGKSGVAVARGVLAWIATDTAVPEPTDAAWPKWVGYGVAGAVAGTYLYATTSHSNDNIQSKKSTTTSDRRQQSYEVRVQAQGTSLRREGSVPLTSKAPILASAVQVALAGTQSQLAKSDQTALTAAFAKASQWVDRVAAGGGITPIGSTSFTVRGTSATEMRVDIEVLRGPINIVE